MDHPDPIAHLQVQELQCLHWAQHLREAEANKDILACPNI